LPHPQAAAAVRSRSYKKTLMASSPRIDELRKKFEENPRRYFAPLANEYRKAGQIDQAIAICREYLPQQPGHMSGHIVYGQALYESRQFEESKAVFETALSLDPENLIALRHLGDIALILGDGEGARGWYRRVLDADPRNEEIQVQLAKLDSGEVGTAATPTPVTPAPAVPAKPSSSKPTPSSAPTVVISAVRPPAPKVAASPPPAPPSQPPVTAESPTAEIRLDAVTPRTEPTAPPPPVQPLELASPVPGVSPQDAAPLDSFSLDGLETTSLTAGQPGSAPPAPTPLANLDLGVSATAPQPAAPEPITLPDLDLGPVSAPPATAAPRAAPPAITVPLDLDFDTAASAPASAPAAVAAPVPELIDLGDPVAAAMSPPPSPPAAVPELDIGEVVVPPSAPPAELEPQASESQALEFLSVDEAPAPAPESGPFVTETMAELYLQQGHREEALRVYKALLEQRPGDPTLQAKVAGLEAELKPRAAATAPARPAAAPVRRDAPVARPRSGPTIREVLYVVAVRRPGFRAEASGQNGSTPAEAPVGGAAVMSSLGPDAIAVLFGNGAVAPEDEGAAMSLALAFWDLNGGSRATSSGGQAGEAPPISGAPARPATNELSLDAVFGGGEKAPPAAPSSFSFDQFFSQRAAAEHGGAAATGGGAAGAAAPDDVAQFTQWLEGLKRR
jgi:tetratricopeptide (TPR) repeat protein